MLLRFPHARPLESGSEAATRLQVKPESKQCQLLMPGEPSGAVRPIRYVGAADSLALKQDDGSFETPTSAHLQYLAVRRGSKLILRPVQDTYCMRPVVEGNAPSSTTPPLASPLSPPSVVTVVKRRETEQQLAARLSSYAHLLQTADSEPWQTFSVVS